MIGHWAQGSKLPESVIQTANIATRSNWRRRCLCCTVSAAVHTVGFSSRNSFAQEIKAWFSLVETVPSSVTPGSYVGCLYTMDSGGLDPCAQCLIIQHDDYKVVFMHAHGSSRYFRWAQREDICWVPQLHILSKVLAPSTAIGRSYKISAEVQCSCRNIFQKSNQQNVTLAVLTLHISLLNLISYIRDNYIQCNIKSWNIVVFFSKHRINHIHWWLLTVIG